MVGRSHFLHQGFELRGRKGKKEGEKRKKLLSIESQILWSSVAEFKRDIQFGYEEDGFPEKEC